MYIYSMSVTRFLRHIEMGGGSNMRLMLRRIHQWMLDSTSNESLGLPWRLHVLFVFLLMKKVLNGRQGLFFAIPFSKFHDGLLEGKCGHVRAMYVSCSSFFPNSMKMFRLPWFPFCGSHMVILGITCLRRRVLQSRIIALWVWQRCQFCIQCCAGFFRDGRKST